MTFSLYLMKLLIIRGNEGKEKYANTRGKQINKLKETVKRL